MGQMKRVFMEQREREMYNGLTPDESSYYERELSVFSKDMILLTPDIKEVENACKVMKAGGVKESVIKFMLNKAIDEIERMDAIDRDYMRHNPKILMYDAQREPMTEIRCKEAIEEDERIESGLPF